MKIRYTKDIEAQGLGRKIFEARKLHKKTLTQIVGEAGMSIGNWYKIETEATKTLPVETLRRIEAVLEVKLIEGSDRKVQLVDKKRYYDGARRKNR